MNKVVVLKYEMGNTDSVVRALERCGGNVILSNSEFDFEAATHIVLPGVGAFEKGMKNINELGIRSLLEEKVLRQKIPFLGICLGMQLLAEKGFEKGENDGLGWVEGSVSAFKKTLKNERIPHIGWNQVNFNDSEPLYDNIQQGSDFYFVHSYHFECADKSNIISQTPYCGEFISSIKKDNIYGVQFHPEKSQGIGTKLLKNFLSFA